MKTVMTVLVLGMLAGSAASPAEPQTDPAKVIQDYDEKLASEDGQVRYRVAWELAGAVSKGKLTGDVPRAALERLLGDSVSGTRQAAVAGLGSLGDKKALPVLVKVGDTGDFYLLASVVRARLALGDEAVRDSLTAMMTGEVDPKGLAAARVLGAMGTDPFLAALRSAGENKNPAVRTRAAFGMGWSKSAEVAGALAALLADGDPKVRRAASDAAGRRGDAGQMAALAGLMREDPDAEVRRSAANSLGLARATMHIDAVLEALAKDGDVSVRAMAATTLGSFRDKRAKDGLLAAASAGEPEVRTSALKALSRLRLGELVPQYIGFLKDDDPKVRHAALGCIAQLKPKEAADALLTVLKADDDAPCRGSAAHILGSVKPEGVSEALLVAMDDKADSVRLNALGALGRLTPPRARPPKAHVEKFVAALTDGNPSIRTNAVRMCGRFGLKSTAEKAAEMLASDGDSHVRSAAAWAIIDLGNRTVTVPALIAALSDEADPVRATADKALRRISGKNMNFRYSDLPKRRAPAIEAWKRWWQAQNAPGI